MIATRKSDPVSPSDHSIYRAWSGRRLRCHLSLGSIWLLLFATAVFGASAESKAPSFDHDVTRFPLTGRHQKTNCESCHVGGQFAGTPTACRSCHASGGSAETRSSPNHIPIQTDCSDCHAPRFWEPARMDHGSVADRCETSRLKACPSCDLSSV